MDDVIEKSAMRKIYLRLLPFAILSYLLAYIDRINASFAALTMRGDLDLTATAYGFAVGTFYWGYFLFEVPSNVVLEKVGARLWIARIMISWGILAGLTAMVATFATWTGVSNATTMPASSPVFSSACRSRWRVVLRFRRRFSVWTACLASGAGRSCTLPRVSRPS
jgi:sugar phosphate permease